MTEGLFYFYDSFPNEKRNTLVTISITVAVHHVKLERKGETMLEQAEIEVCLNTSTVYNS